MKTIWHDVEQNTPAWDELRLGKATSSCNAAFMANDGKAFGEPAKRLALKIALERVTGRKAEYSFRSDDMDRGHEQEPMARMLYEEMFFAEVTNGGFFDCGDYGDSPDGLVGDDGIIEIKSVIAPVHFATMQRGKPDPAYLWQIAGHLDCSGRQWVDYVSYCPEFPEWAQLVVYRVTRDDMDSEIARLRDRRNNFLALVDERFNQLQQRQAA